MQKGDKLNPRDASQIVSATEMPPPELFQRVQRDLPGYFQACCLHHYFTSCISLLFAEIPKRVTSFGNNQHLPTSHNRTDSRGCRICDVILRDRAPVQTSTSAVRMVRHCIRHDVKVRYIKIASIGDQATIESLARS